MERKWQGALGLKESYWIRNPAAQAPRSRATAEDQRLFNSFPSEMLSLSGVCVSVAIWMLIRCININLEEEEKSPSGIQTLVHSESLCKLNPNN